MKQLISKHDQDILNIILSGEESTTSIAAYIVDPELVPDPNVRTETVSVLVEREKKAIDLVESGRVGEAEEILDEIISQYPNYASAYNNRAQVYRETDKTSKAATQDLEKAIGLAKPGGRFLSKMQATVLKNAHAQLAAIELELAKESTDEHKRWDHNERASHHLSLAGSFGDRILTALSIKVNPYAKLCGGMVEQALKTERE